MRTEFVEAFKDLDVNDKRNELNNEMETSFEILKMMKQMIGIELTEEDVITNYDMVNDSNFTESEMLDKLYFDFFIIQKNILDIANVILNKE